MSEQREPRYLTITFYANQYENMRALPVDKRLQLFEAICEYELYGDIAEFDGNVLMQAMFGMMRPGLDSIMKKKKGGESGGRPKERTEDAEDNHAVQQKSLDGADKSTGNHDNASGNRDCTAENHGGTIENHGGTIENHGGTIENHGGTTDNHDETTPNPMRNDKWEMVNVECERHTPLTPHGGNAADAAGECAADAGVQMTMLDPDSSADARDAPVPDSSPPEPEAKPKRRRRTSDLTAAQQQRFDRWYAIYPRKKAPAVAEKAWKRIDPDDALTAEMIEAVRVQQVKDKDWLRGFIPNPATWLNGKQWQNEYPDEAASRPADSDAGACSTDWSAKLAAAEAGEDPYPEETLSSWGSTYDPGGFGTDWSAKLAAAEAAEAAAAAAGIPEGEFSYGT